MEISGNGCAFRSGYLNRLFNIFLPSNIHCSAIPEAKSSNESVLSSGAFGFTRLSNLSPVEASFLATSSLFERLAFLAMQLNMKYTDEIMDAFVDLEGPKFSQNDATSNRAVARLLLSSTKDKPSLLRTKIGTGPGDCPYEALVLSHHDRLASNIRLLRSAYAFIPPARAPPVSPFFLCMLVYFWIVHCMRQSVCLVISEYILALMLKVWNLLQVVVLIKFICFIKYCQCSLTPVSPSPGKCLVRR